MTNHCGEEDQLTSRFCPHCGSQVAESDRQCTVCGAQLPGPTPAAAPTASSVSGAAPAAGGSAQAAGAWPTAASQQATPAAMYAAYQPAAVVRTAQAQGTPAAAPGAPVYPQGYQAYQAYQTAQTQQGHAATPYGYGYPYPYYYSPYPAQQKKPGETYAKVLSWILVFLCGLSALGGLVVLLIGIATALGSVSALAGEGGSLTVLAQLAGFGLALLLGGAFGMYYSVTGIMRRPSPKFTLPPAWVMLALTLLALVGGVALWHVNAFGYTTPGTALGVLPLAALCGIAPAATILAFTSQRLGDPATRRHVWMSLFWGAAGATLLAAVLELVLGVIVAVLMNVPFSTALNTNLTSGNPAQSLFILIEISIIAPVVEEGLKPLGALLIIRRLRTPGQAFLVGMAGGIGFDLVETIGYIGMGQADWVYVAIERIGAGLLHGVGAGMAALGWYYLINGKGVPLRWLKGIGCGVYAVVQHAVFNGSNLIALLIPGLSAPLAQPLYLVKLPFESAALIFMVLYVVILTVLIVVTGRIRNAKGMAPPTPKAPAVPTLPYPAYLYSTYPGYQGVPAQTPTTTGGSRS